MITRNTWILLGLLVVLVGVAFFIPWYQGRQPKPTPTASTPLPQNVISGGEVAQFSVVSKDGKTVTVKSTGPGQWTVTEPTNLTYDPAIVNSAADFFKTAVVQTALPTQPPADAMGISSPEETITILMSDGGQKVMKVGSPTPIGDGYYVQVDSQPAFTVSKTDMTNVLTLLTAGVPPATPSAAVQGSGTPVSDGISPTQPAPAASPTAP